MKQLLSLNVDPEYYWQVSNQKPAKARFSIIQRNSNVKFQLKYNDILRNEKSKVDIEDFVKWLKESNLASPKELLDIYKNKNEPINQTLSENKELTLMSIIGSLTIAYSQTALKYRKDDRPNFLAMAKKLEELSFNRDGDLIKGMSADNTRKILSKATEIFKHAQN